MTAPLAEPRPLPAAVDAGPAADDTRSAVWLLLPAALLITLLVQARTVTFFFFQDDYVAFGEIVTNGTRDYVWNLLTLQDLTPNWRVMTGLTYLASYHTFGMAAWPTHVLMLALHLASVALVYRAVRRMGGGPWAAFAAALVLGISPAYAGTFGQLGSVTYTWAAVFLLAVLNCCLEAAESDDAGRSLAWIAAGAVLYVFALASNESMAIMFPAFALALLLADRRGSLRDRIVRASLRSLPFAALGLATAISFAACDCTAAEDTFGTENVHRAFLIYLGRLVYPAGLEPPTYIDPPHLVAGIALLLVSAAALAAGNASARVGVAWMVLAIAPHALIEDHTAHRFVYLATPGFALLVAGLVAIAEPHLRRLGDAPAIAVLVLLVAAVVPLYAWQSHRENDVYARLTGDWRLLHDEVDRVFPFVPRGSTVEVVGGPLTHPLDNFFVMPALGYTIWGPGVILQTVASDDPYADDVRTGDNPYAAEFDGRRLQPLH